MIVREDCHKIIQRVIMATKAEKMTIKLALKKEAWLAAIVTW